MTENLKKMAGEFIDCLTKVENAEEKKPQNLGGEVWYQ